MKLLFDENLSPKLPALLTALFPGSIHVRECGLLGKADSDIWEYARAHEFIIVSKDCDFQQRSLLDGHPPKVVWLRIGNCRLAQIVTMMKVHEQVLLDFESNPLESLLILS
ncbi:DUF5615 family PIN-like protein [Kamptonema cortianum]|nr:DUF5615 family PIN-like protein [Oscillatoria laete-virens]MDK3159499.1 DUF5615 family PIN-like protein [Kamptonema cortianum]MDL5053039.1 DUF5615 family PIN-like protein [Oscillatoria laete-virens NRMC-F 0139]